jgi:HEAT repeat protein
MAPLTAAELIAEARESTDWKQRRLAIIGLGHRRDEEILGVLLQCLDDPVDNVRHAAVISLGRYGDRRAVPELLRPKVLAALDPNVRWAAVSALGKLGDHQIIDELVERVDDEEWLVHNEALVVLREKVAEIIEAHDLELARVLIRMMNLPDRKIVEMAQGGLRGLGHDASPMLCEALENVREPVRRHAAEVMGQIGDSDTLPALIETLADASPAVRAEAATAIGRIGAREGLRPLLEAMGDHDEEVRRRIDEALVRFGKDATELLCIALEHAGSKLARCTAIDTLGEIGDERAIPILIEHLSSSYYLVRTGAIRALKRFGQAPVERLLMMLSYNTSDISLLLDEVVGSTDLQTRMRAAGALGVLEDHRAVNPLKSLLSDPEEKLATAAQEALGRIGCSAWGRSGAARILGSIGDQRALPGVLELLDDDSITVRTAAAESLMGLGGEESAERLLHVARTDPDPVVRDAALSSLHELVPGSPELLDVSLGLLGDPEAEVRVRATRIVGEYLDDRTIDPLLLLLSDSSWRVRVSAESALCTQGKQAVPRLLDILERGSLVARRRTISALGRIGDLRATQPIGRVLETEADSGTRQLAREALRELRGGEDES